MSAPGVPLGLWFRELSTEVWSAPDAGGAVDLALPVGSSMLAREVLRHTPPRPLEIEQAIEVVEEAVMPARAQLPEAIQLFCTDPLLHALAAAEPQADDPVWLSMEAVEQLFNRLVARAEGRPAPQDDLPVDAASAARLVIVREILHHWGLNGLYLAISQGAPHTTTNSALP